MLRPDWFNPKSTEMTLNRRHKAVLFITLVVSGCALLLGTELKEAIGFMMLGAAFAWAIGSNTASRVYARLKGASGTFYSWVRLPLAMALAGGVLGAVLLYSRANPVLVVAFMCAAGIFIAPLAPLPTQRIWLKVPLVLLAVAAYLVAAWGMINTDLIASNKYGERYGELSITGLFTFIAGFFWLSKGWGLIGRGISSVRSADISTSMGSAKRAWPHYISLFLGVLVLTLWLGLLAWSASSDWEYAPAKIADTKGNNLFFQFVFVVLLASWPYSSWKTILGRESNASSRYLRRHRLTSAVAGMIFFALLSLAITYGMQNGNDRRMVEKIEAAAKDLTAVGTEIGTIKRRDLRTTDDYIKAYAEIDALLPDFESKINECAEVYEEARQIDEGRGPINAQFFYKSHKPDLWRNQFDMLDLLRQADSLTKQEVLTTQNMALLSPRDQAEYWEKEFRPLLAQQDELGEKIQVVAAKIQSPTH
jgi:hypothetical protein